MVRFTLKRSLRENLLQLAGRERRRGVGRRFFSPPFEQPIGLFDR